MIIVATIKSLPGKSKEIEDALREMVLNVKAEDETMIYILHRSKNDPDKFLMYEKYKNKAAFDHHSSTSYFKAFFDKIENLIAESPSIEMYDELAAK